MNSKTISLKPLSQEASAVPPTRTLTAGAGLTGGGDLTADRTFDVVANADGSIVVNANDIQVGVLANDAQHGNLGGGLLHAVFTTGAAGFAPTSPGGTSAFLRADGTWATPPAFGEYSGTFDASAGTFPGGAGTNQGDWYNTTVAGTVDGEPFAVGDLLVAVIDNPSTTTFAGNWTRIPNVSTADVQGPASATDNAIARYDGTTGKLIQNSLVLIDDSGNLTTPGTIDGLDVGALDTDLETFSLPANTTISAFGASLVDDPDAATARATLGVPPDTRDLIAGAGLTGGGDLTADRTFDVGANADGSITVNADDIQVGVLATDAQHGNRGNGALHTVFDAATNGFTPASGGGTVNFLRADGTWADPMGAAIFGSEFEESYSDGQQSTTSGTYITPFSFTTAVVPAGDYMIQWFCDAGEDTDKSASHRITLDGTEIANIEWRIKEGEEADGIAWTAFAGHRIVTLTNAAHTLAFQYRADTTAYIRRKQFSIFRVA